MICERCKTRTNSLKMSFFNTEMCCETCLNSEKQNPRYEEAKKVEREEILKGNYNFKGIGL